MADASPSRPDARPRARTLVLVTVAYLVCLAAATYPRVLSLASQLPSVPDPITHLWTLRWYRTCLLEGKSVFFLPDIQAPVGAPLGLVPPLHLQALMYIPLSLVIPNDILCYNIIWIAEFLLTGLGTFALAWYVARSQPAAFVAGLLAMLSGPMMMHGFGHIELMALGFFPLFVLAWMRFLDEPGRRRLAAAVATYVLVVMSAAYFAVLAVVPAVLYAAGGAIGAARRRDASWFRARLPWLAAFVGLVLPAVLVLFSSQLWAAAQGQKMTRPRAEYIHYGAPAWSFVVPTTHHALGRLLPSDPYAAARVPIVECSSYLGLATLGLLLYAAAARARFPGARYFWTGLAVLVVLSWGASLEYGEHKIDLPGWWLWKSVFAFRMIRVPARFNLFAAVFAAVVAAAGLAHLLGRLQRRTSRAAVVSLVALAAVADLALVPFPSAAIPRMPACYAMLRDRAPGATILEIPQFPSAACSNLNAMAAYWQSFHRGRTTAGYGAHPNDRYDDLLGLTTPFNAYDLIDPNFLANPSAGHVTINTNVPMADYMWLYLTTLGIDYVVLHRWPGCDSGLPIRLEEVEAILRPALIYEDQDTLVYERAKLPEPTRPVMRCGEGWRRYFIWKDRPTRVVDRTAEVIVYSSSPDRPVSIQVEAAALRYARKVRLREGERVLADWTVPVEGPAIVSSPPFRLEKGLHTLVLESDRDVKPRRRRDMPADGDARPYSLRVVQVSLLAAPVTAEVDRTRR